MNMSQNVQKVFKISNLLVRDNYDILHNPKVKENYPRLYAEVLHHDEKCKSSWYVLSDSAFAEYGAYQNDYKIGYID